MRSENNLFRFLFNTKTIMIPATLIGLNLQSFVIKMNLKLS